VPKKVEQINDYLVGIKNENKANHIVRATFIQFSFYPGFAVGICSRHLRWLKVSFADLAYKPVKSIQLTIILFVLFISYVSLSPMCGLLLLLKCLHCWLMMMPVSVARLSNLMRIGMYTQNAIPT